MKIRFEIAVLLCGLALGLTHSVDADLIWRQDFEGNLLDTSQDSVDLASGGATGAEPFDGTLRDGSGAAAGTITGFVDGRIGQAVEFDGTTSAIDIPPTSGPLSAWTAACWINIPAPEFGVGLHVLLATNTWNGGADDVVLHLNGLGLYYNLPGGGISVSDTFDPNQEGTWIHLATSHRVGGDSKAYINATLVGSTIVGGTEAPSRWDIGAGIGGWQAFSTVTRLVAATTLIDDVRFYDAELTQGEITDVMNEGTAGYVATVTETDASTKVAEDGLTTDTFTVQLDTAPTANVIIDLAKTVNAGDFTIDTTQLTFTTGDWNTPQTVTVQAADDTDVDWDELGYISFTLSSTDLNYDGKAVRDLRVDIEDDDNAWVNLAFSDGSTEVLEGGFTDTVGVMLSLEPTNPVEVFFSHTGDPNQITIEPEGNLNFNSSNWDIPKFITITAIDDNDLETDPHSAAVDVSAESADLRYDVLVIPSFNVDVLENECGAWSFSLVDLDESCASDLVDFAILSLSWMNCSSPNVGGCIDYR